MRCACALFTAFMVCAVEASAVTVQVLSSQIRVYGDAAGVWASLETADGRDLLYDAGTSRQVFNLNGNVKGLASAAPADIIQYMTASGAGLGAKLACSAREGNLTYGTEWTIVADPHLGTGQGYVQILAYVSNQGPLNAYVGYRLELDVQLIDRNHDNAFLSQDNGLTVFDRNVLFQAITGPIPSDWWAYDVYPIPSLAARGVTWGNSYGLPATQPDAIEFCEWEKVSGADTYVPHPEPGRLFSSYSRPDTAVVLWYTNTGQALGNNYVVAPGQTLAWVTYYGLNTQPLGATATPYHSYTPTPTRSPTQTISPTWTVSPTISPTHSITPTFSISPTFSMSPTLTQTYTISPTFSATPSFSHSPTLSPTPTVSPTWTVSPTPSATPSFSPSPTPSPTPTVTPTPSISPTHTHSPTFTQTPPPDLVLTPKPPNPNPSGDGGTWLPYVLSRDAEVRIRIYDVAGETVRDLEPFPGRMGANEQFWDQRNSAGARVASGVFIVHIVATAGGQFRDAWVKCAVVR